MTDLATARANFDKLEADVNRIFAIDPADRTPRQTESLVTDAVTAVRDAHTTFDAIAAIVTTAPVAAPAPAPVQIPVAADPTVLPVDDGTPRLSASIYSPWAEAYATAHGYNFANLTDGDLTALVTGEPLGIVQALVASGEFGYPLQPQIGGLPDGAWDRFTALDETEDAAGYTVRLYIHGVLVATIVNPFPPFDAVAWAKANGLAG